MKNLGTFYMLSYFTFLKNAILRTKGFFSTKYRNGSWHGKCLFILYDIPNLYRRMPYQSMLTLIKS